MPALQAPTLSQALSPQNLRPQVVWMLRNEAILLGFVLPIWSAANFVLNPAMAGALKLLNLPVPWMQVMLEITAFKIVPLMWPVGLLHWFAFRLLAQRITDARLASVLAALVVPATYALGVSIAGVRVGPWPIDVPQIWLGIVLCAVFGWAAGADPAGKPDRVTRVTAVCGGAVLGLTGVYYLQMHVVR